MEFVKAPILEAILDLQVSLPENTDLKKVTKHLLKQYPEENVIRQETTKFQSSDHGSTFITDRKDIGYKLTSDNKKTNCTNKKTRI